MTVSAHPHSCLIYTWLSLPQSQCRNRTCMMLHLCSHHFFFIFFYRGTIGANRPPSPLCCHISVHGKGGFIVVDVFLYYVGGLWKALATPGSCCQDPRSWILHGSSHGAQDPLPPAPGLAFPACREMLWGISGCHSVRASQGFPLTETCPKIFRGTSQQVEKYCMGPSLGHCVSTQRPMLGPVL